MFYENGSGYCVAMSPSEASDSFDFQTSLTHSILGPSPDSGVCAAGSFRPPPPACDGTVSGARLRSAGPGIPSSLKRIIHLWPVLWEMPKRRHNWATLVTWSSHASTNNSRSFMVQVSFQGIGLSSFTNALLPVNHVPGFRCNLCDRFVPKDAGCLPAQA